MSPRSRNLSFGNVLPGELIEQGNPKPWTPDLLSFDACSCLLLKNQQDLDKSWGGQKSLQRDLGSSSQAPDMEYWE